MCTHQAYYLQMYALLTGSYETDVSRKVAESKWSKPSLVGIKWVLWLITCRSFAIILNCNVQCGEADSICPLEELIKNNNPIRRQLHLKIKEGVCRWWAGGAHMWARVDMNEFYKQFEKKRPLDYSWYFNFLRALFHDILIITVFEFIAKQWYIFKKKIQNVLIFYF